MCGIAGFWDTRGETTLDAARETLAAMTDTLRHRGPDDEGQWIDVARGVALGHRRLSIIDRSGAGHQPMTSADGRWTITYNGEIYNFRELRIDLEASGVGLRGSSDTEVLVEAIARWGLESALGRVVGMFAFALWDRDTETLHLARDRFGEKPLYYGWMGRIFLFASELQAMRRHPAWRAGIDRQALALYMRYAYVPAPRSIHERVFKLEAGHVATISRGGAVHSRPYWSLADVAARGLADPIDASDAEVVDLVERQLRDTIRGQLVADVPLGALLSGGFDSSLVVALMQSVSSDAVRTFTIGFRERGYDEAPHASAIAAHLGTRHTELYVTPEETREVIPRLARMYSEPFADASQIPTYLVAALARRDVTVALSGDGGDELFGGYRRYVLGPRIWDRLAPWPPSMRRLAARGVQSFSPAAWGRVLGAAQHALPRRMRVAHPGDGMHKLARILGASRPLELYQTLLSQWDARDGGELVKEATATVSDPTIPLAGATFAEQMMYHDAVAYLPDDILVKVDRATMAVSLEARAPFLDHRLAELAWRLPRNARIRDGETKWVLRRILDRLVPQSLTERPKMGFSVPLDAWLRGPLREWAGDLLSTANIERDGLLSSVPIERAWREHLSGGRNWQHRLWNVLMFLDWQNAQRDAVASLRHGV